MIIFFEKIREIIIIYNQKKAINIQNIYCLSCSEDLTWEHIVKNHAEKINNIDILFAPHHGRDSNRNFDLLKSLTPTITLFGNASSKHLAYSKYKGTRITNNQAGYVILDISSQRIQVFVKHFEFARDFSAKRGWSLPTYNSTHKAYFLCQITAK